MLWWTLQELKSSNVETRLRAARKLGTTRDQRAIEALILALKDREFLVRHAAEEALNAIDPNWLRSSTARSAVPAFIAALTEQDREVRKSAAYVLGTICDLKASDALIARLADHDRDVRKAAAESLGMMRSKKAVPALVSVLGDSDSDVRKSATYALWNIGDERAIQPLIGELNDPNRAVREAAAEALQALGWRAQTTEEKALLAVAVHDWDMASQLGKDAFDILVATLKDHDKEIQQGAIEALGKIGDPQALEPLFDMLKHWEPDVRRAALRALSIIHDPRAVDAILVLLDDKEGEVRKMAAKALGEFKQPQSVTPLLARLKDKESGVRQTAAEALGKLGDPQATSYLVAGLVDEDSEVREASAWALSALRWVPEDEIQFIRCSIALRNWDELVNVGAAAIPFLIDALNDKHNYVRVAAAYALGQIKDPAASDQLLNLLKHRNAEVRGVVAEALGSLGDVRAVRPLLRLTEDSDIASRVIGALRQLLEQSAPQFSIDELRAVIRLDNVQQVRLETDRQLETYKSWNTKQLVNCGYIRQLAQEELSRRGLTI